MMPRDRKRTPNKSAQNSLADGERDDVALARKEPRHGNSTNEGKRNQDGIRPMKGSKNCAGEQRSKRRAIDCAEEPVRGIGIQSHLLEQAKRHVAKKTIRH